MSLIQHIKNFIPIIFGILFNLIFFILSILAFLGKYPFKKINNDLGMLLMVLFLFAFYPGMLLGSYISYLLNICIILKPNERLLNYDIEKNNKTNKTNKINYIDINNTNNKYIDF